MVANIPLSVQSLKDVAYDWKDLSDFFKQQFKNTKIFLDDTCELPHNWNQTWWNVSQWGDLGQQHWRKKYAAAGFLPRMVMNSPFYEKDWRKADFSIVILYARHYAGGVTILQQQCLQRLQKYSLAFQKTQGRNHFFIFTDSRGACSLDGKFKDVEFLKHHVIGQHGEVYNKNKFFFRRGSGPLLRCYDYKRDVNIPTPNIHTFPDDGSGYEDMYSITHNKSLLMFYAGWNYDTRMKLVNYYKNDSDVIVRRSIPKYDYNTNMSRTKYCPVCGGFSQWTPRLMEAIYYGCIPVILSDHWELPFSHIVNWTKFSVRVMSNQYKNIKEIIRSLPYDEMHKNLKLVQPIFRYHLHSYTENDMFPIFIYETMKKINYIPVIPNITIISNSIVTDKDYNIEMPLKGRKAHNVNANSTFIINHEKEWSCSTRDGYFVNCLSKNIYSIKKNKYIPNKIHNETFSSCIKVSIWPFYNFSCIPYSKLHENTWRIPGEINQMCWSFVYEGLIICN